MEVKTKTRRPRKPPGNIRETSSNDNAAEKKEGQRTTSSKGRTGEKTNLQNSPLVVLGLEVWVLPNGHNTAKLSDGRRTPAENTGQAGNAKSGLSMQKIPRPSDGRVPVYACPAWPTT